MHRDRRPLPADLGDAFTWTAARAAGVTPGRLRGDDLTRPFRGARLRPDPAPVPADDTPLARDRAQRRRVLRLVTAYRPLMNRHAFFTGRTAAVLWGLPIAHGEDLEVGIPSPLRAARRRGIRGRKILPSLVEIRTADRLPISSPATTWAVLGAELSVRELVILGDAIVRVPRDEFGTLRPELALATIDDLRAVVAASRPGVRRLRDAVEHVRVGSASPLETEHRLDAASAGLPDPVLDQVIRDHEGRMLGISELVHPRWRVVVEIEGDHHRTSRRQWQRDLDKYAAYANAGWEVVRLASHRVRHRPQEGIAQVRAALIRHGWRP